MTAPRPPSRPLPWAPLLLAAAACALALPLADLLLDDTYITLRYGRNLAAGAGPVYNPGEWVEGFTSPLWMLVAALLHLLPVSPSRAIVGGSALAMVAALVATERLGAALGLDLRSRLVAVCLLLAHAATFAWAFTGMDTAAFVLVGVLLLLAVARDRAGAAALLAGLLGWVRPEGWLLGPAALALGLREREGRLRGLAGAGALLALLFGLRLALYGDLLPNTFYAKVPMGWRQLGWGAAYLAGGIAGAGFGALHLMALGGALRVRREPPWRGILAWTLLVHAVVLVEGGDTFPLDRFLLPALPPLALLAAAFLERMAFRGPRGRGLEVALVALVWVASSRPHRLEPAFLFRAQTELYEQMGAVMARRAEPGWLATPAAGALPYVTGFPTIDTVGLTDATLARGPVDPEALRAHQRGDPDHVLERRPAYWVPGPVELPPGPVEDPRSRPYASLVGRAHAFPSERGAWQDPRFLAGYRAEALVLPDGRRLLVFVRRDVPWGR